MVAVLYADGHQMYGGWLASIVGLGLLAGEIIGGLLATPLGKTKFQMMFAVTAAFILFACKSSQEYSLRMLAYHILTHC